MNRMRSIRYDRKRISQFELRRLTGIHQSRLSLIENDLIEAREEEKERLAKALGVSIAEIFPNNESKIPPKKNTEEQRTACGRR